MFATHTDTHTHIHTNTQIDRQTHRRTHTEIDTQTDRQTARQTETHTDRQTDRHTPVIFSRFHLIIYLISVFGYSRKNRKNKSSSRTGSQGKPAFWVFPEVYSYFVICCQTYLNRVLTYITIMFTSHGVLECVLCTCLGANERDPIY